MTILTKLQALIPNELGALNDAITKELEHNLPFIDELCRYIIESGGKRLRPLTVILSARAVGYTGNQHIQLAAAMEFFHTATLLHDDVVDESSLRRGKATANHIWGSKASVLVGDFLFTRAFQLLSNSDNHAVIRLLANTSNMITQGEILQLVNCNDPKTTKAQYLEVITHKTAALFSAAAQLGALLDRAPQAIVEALAAYGLHLGRAFQLVDDALDYISDTDTIGKSIGDDLAEGKPTLPLIYALEKANPEQKALIKQAILKADVDNLGPILEAIKETNAIDYTYAEAKKEIDAARNAIYILKDTPYRQALIELAEFAISRSY